MFKNKREIKRNYAESEIDDAVLTVTEKEVAKLEAVLNRRLIEFFWWIIVLVFLILAGRVVYLVVWKGDYYRQVAQENRIRELVIKAPRGKIYDRFGKTLVYNIPSMNAVIFPADLPKETALRKTMSQKLSDILKINQGEIWGKMESSDLGSWAPILLAMNISQEEALVIMEKEKEFPGVKIEKTSARQYVDGLIFSHILGYEGKIQKEELEKHPDYLLTDCIGKYGLEKFYESRLRGTHGRQRMEVDSLGNIKQELGVVDPLPGSDLYLNIDADLQKKVFDVIQKILETEKLSAAAAVALNPQNGEVLALVSLPGFDNNLFARGISAEDYQKIISDFRNPMYNRAVSGKYPPGSTIKPLIASAALEEGVITEQTQIESRGGIQVGGWFFGDWKAHGFTDVRRAIAVSSDVFFYSVGGGYGGIKGLGMDTMKKYEEMFGLGKITGIDLPGEASGFIPDEKWKEETLGEKWYVGNSYHAAIGQGYITATPLQITNYISAIANGGTLFRPRIVSQTKNQNGVVELNSVEIINKNFISPEIIKIVREGMRMTVTEGTAQVLNELPVEIAGKTGTAQFGSGDKTQGWFVSFAPYNNPQITLVILIEGQEKNTYNAVPAAKEIYEWYFGDKTLSIKKQNTGS